MTSSARSGRENPMTPAWKPILTNLLIAAALIAAFAFYWFQRG